ncbi:uncharacterized protein LOC114022415 isoform X3 [Chelonia mydas]|uniref:uncharacterized protein LOC114022415 isoform X3 n=1 Tax=Chelonia mydas TaxID=8469 RepID=UPI0018A1DA40|nr:uncharacterized protein LOC114022415 isoform X3 [Chelonia mydas]
MGPVLAVWGRLSSKLGAPVALGGRAGRCLQPPTSDTKAREGAKLCPEGPVARTEPIPHRGPQGAPLGDRCTETLFITLPEMDLWEQLSGVLATSLWQVMAREHCQGDAGILALSSPQEAVLAAKVAISELLILMGRAVPSMGWFFRPCPGLSLFLGEGDGGLRAGAVEMLGGESSPDSGASMVIQRVLSRRGAPHTCLEICSLPGAMGPAAGAVLLTLEAVARAQVASVAICMDLEGACLVEAVAEAIDTFARGRPAAPLSSVSMVAADGALVATFHGACAKRWPPGESWQELLGNVLRAQEKVSTQVVSGSPASQKVMRQMVRCCLCSVYGTFLESMSFPLLGAGQTLPAMLEEISCYLEHQPNTWMKLVQIVRPLGLLAPRLVAEDPSTRADRCLASHWEPMGESLVRLVELAEGSEEYREMAEGFKRMAPGYCILHIQRVQNRVLWVSYCWQRHWMEEKNLPGELNERLLYHGTQPENRHSIQEIGLRITCRKGTSALRTKGDS